MARRPASVVGGWFLPDLPDGLRAHWSRFHDRIPTMGEKTMRALSRGDRIVLEGMTVFDALYQLGHEAADEFTWISGVHDHDMFAYDPLTGHLTPHN